MIPAAIIGVAGGYVFKPFINESLDTLKRLITAYSAEDQKKIDAIEKFYKEHLVSGDVMRDQKEDKNHYIRDQMLANFNRKEFEVGRSSKLHEFEIGKKLNHFSSLQSKFISKRIIGKYITPEEIVLQEIQLWLAKLSTLSDDSFNDNLLTTIKKRKNYLNSIMGIAGWRPDFTKDLRQVIDYVELILRKIELIVNTNKCRKSLVDISTEAITIISDSLAFIYHGREDREFLLSDFSIDGFYRQKEILKTFYHGKLILHILHVIDYYKNLGREDKAAPEASEQTTSQPQLPRYTTTQQKNFKEFTESICKFVSFSNLCKKFEKANEEIGSLLIGTILNTGGINISCKLLDLLVVSIKENFTEIDKEYESQREGLETAVSEIKKSRCSCLKCCEENKKKKELDMLIVQTNQMVSYSSALTQKLANCKNLIKEMKERALVDDQKEMRNKIHMNLVGVTDAAKDFFRLVDSNALLNYELFDSKRKISEPLHLPINVSPSSVSNSGRVSISERIDVDVPSDNHCWFWSIGLSWLLQAVGEANQKVTRSSSYQYPEAFAVAYGQLFGVSGRVSFKPMTSSSDGDAKSEEWDIDSPKTIETAYKMLLTYDGKKDTPNEFEGDILSQLICKVFRENLVRFMRKAPTEVNLNACLHDAKASYSGKEGGWDKHLTNISRADTWGGTAESAAIACMINAEVHVYHERADRSGGDEKEIYQPDRKGRGVVKSIYIIHAYGSDISEQRGHYRMALRREHAFWRLPSNLSTLPDSKENQTVVPEDKNDFAENTETLRRRQSHSASHSFWSDDSGSRNDSSANSSFRNQETLRKFGK